ATAAAIPTDNLVQLAETLTPLTVCAAGRYADAALRCALRIFLVARIAGLPWCALFTRETRALRTRCIGLRRSLVTDAV
ncbi:MAG TPA: hypothetical protein VJR89_20115, partial [Polyangiales bacterium]|nr:hypothetical protein [Polyangiales bacterium]